MNNYLKPSHSYLEGDLADKLEVSRTPVREAMLQLEKDGFVTVRPRYGMIVLPISVNDLIDIYEIRRELEVLAAGKVAERRLDEDERVSFEKLIISLNDTLDQDDRKQWALHDDEFHHLLAVSSRNRYLAHTLSQYRDQIHRARISTLHLRNFLHQSNEDHAILLRYFIEQNVEEARNHHAKHIDNSAKTIISLMKEHNLADL